MAKVIADTGPLVALLDEAEEHHKWTREQLRLIEGPLLTCDAVLTETCYLLSGYPSALRQLRHYLAEKLIVSAFESTPRMTRIFDLMATYHNVPMSFADACLVCLVESMPGSFVFTLDRDFTIYRQQRRRVIPLIAPF
jgi:predicted nucleic acid-binding protein